MKKLTLWSLIALNVALLTVFVYRMVPENAASAQAARPGDYLMIPGEVIGGVNAVVWVLDQTNHQLTVMSYDDSSGTLAKMTPRDIDRDFDARPMRRPR
jgi:hypothetical protein